MSAIRYINVDRLLERLGQDPMHDLIRRALMTAPVEDLEHVTRCGQCRHYKPGKCRLSPGVRVAPQDYCSHAEAIR